MSLVTSAGRPAARRTICCLATVDMNFYLLFCPATGQFLEFLDQLWQFGQCCGQLLKVQMPRFGSFQRIQIFRQRQRDFSTSTHYDP